MPAIAHTFSGALLLSLAVTTAASAQNVGPGGADLPPQCRLPLPADSFEFDAINVFASPRVRVDVTATERPVVLFLTSLQSVTWQIEAVDGAKVAGVIVAGDQPSQATGGALDGDVPIIDAYAESECGRDVGGNRSHRHFKLLHAMAARIAGKAFDTFQQDWGERRFVVGPGAMHIATHSAPPPELILYHHPKSRDPVVLDLVAAGHVRSATEAEIYAWESQDPELNRYGLTKGAVRYYYTILEPFEFPPEMANSNGDHFLLPPGMKLPTGPWGGSRVYLMEPRADCSILEKTNVCVDPSADQVRLDLSEPMPDWARDQSGDPSDRRQSRLNPGDPCRIENLPSDVDFIAMGIHESSLVSGLWAVRPIPQSYVPRPLYALKPKIEIAKSDRPVALMLTSDRWTNWNIQNDQGTVIEAIILSGTRPQIVQGLNPGDRPPLVNATPGADCYSDSPVALDESGLAGLRDFAVRVAGSAPVRFVPPNTDGEVVTLVPMPPVLAARDSGGWMWVALVSLAILATTGTVLFASRRSQARRRP